MSVSDEALPSGKSITETAVSGQGKKRFDLAIAFAFCGALLFLLVFLYMFKQDRDAAILSFQAQTAEDIALFEKTLTHNLYSLIALNTYFQLIPSVNETDFMQAARLISQQHSAVAGVFWWPAQQENYVSFYTARDTALSEHVNKAISKAWKADPSEITNSFQAIETQTLLVDTNSYLLIPAQQFSGRLAILIDLSAVIKDSLLQRLRDTRAIQVFVSKGEGEQLVWLSEQGSVAEDSQVSKVVSILGGTQIKVNFTSSESHLTDQMSYLSALFLLTGLLLSFLVASYVKRIVRHVNQLKHEQDVLSEQMIDTSWNDPLTGLVNHVHFDEALDVECRRAVRDFSPLSMILLRIDHYTAYVDYYGQDAANILIQRISETLKGCASRPGDMLARVDDNLFGFILPSTNELVTQLAERCCSSVSQLNIPNESKEEGAYVTVSSGVATLQPTCLLTAKRLFDITHNQLDDALIKGGNQYKAYIENSTEPSLTYSV